MHPEDRLDALLAALQRPERVRAAGPPTDRAHGGPASHADVSREDEPLLPLVEVAQRLQPLRAAQPNPIFAQGLQNHLLARAAQRRQAAVMGGRPGPRVATSARPISVPTVARGAIRPALAAAAVVLALGMGLLSVAAAAPPGSLLFGLRRFEETAQLATSLQNGERARLYLAHARQWLAAVHDAAAQQRGDPTYSDALRALRDDAGAADSEIAGLPPTRERAALESQLAALRADERTTLSDALRSITWPDRLATTQALGELGVTVPRISSVVVVASGERLRATLIGTGFQPGAIVLVNRQPEGTVLAVSDGQLLVTLPVVALSDAPASLGVSNPDGTAAAIDDVRTSVVSTPSQPAGTPEPDDEHTQPTATPGGDEHGQATPQATSEDTSSSASPTPGK